MKLLQLAADRAATAVQLLLTRDDRAAAVALRAACFLPLSRSPDGAQLAGRYVAGAGVVGGDWHDVFTRPAGELCAVIGDVAGSGLAAAVIMGRMRSALRAYALDTADPAGVLAKLDAKLQHFEPGALATVAYAVFDPGLDRMRLCSAGHYFRVIASPGRPAELAEVPADVLIGVVPGARREATTIKTGPLVCSFTDGLIERRDVPIYRGLARLSQAVTRSQPMPPAPR